MHQDLGSAGPHAPPTLCTRRDSRRDCAREPRCTNHRFGGILAGNAPRTAAASFSTLHQEGLCTNQGGGEMAPRRANGVQWCNGGILVHRLSGHAGFLDSRNGVHRSGSCGGQVHGNPCALPQWCTENLCAGIPCTDSGAGPLLLHRSWPTARGLVVHLVHLYSGAWRAKGSRAGVEKGCTKLFLCTSKMVHLRKGRGSACAPFPSPVHRRAGCTHFLCTILLGVHHCLGAV